MATRTGLALWERENSCLGTKASKWTFSASALSLWGSRDRAGGEGSCGNWSRHRRSSGRRLPARTKALLCSCVLGMARGPWLRRGEPSVFLPRSTQQAHSIRDVGLPRFNVDMTGHEPGRLRKARPDRAEALRQTRTKMLQQPLFLPSGESQ